MEDEGYSYSTQYSITRVERNHYTCESDWKRYSITQPSLLSLRRKRGLVMADLGARTVAESTKRASGRHWDVVLNGHSHTLTMHTARWAHVFYFDLGSRGRCALTYNPLICDVRAEKSDVPIAKVDCGGSRKTDHVEIFGLSGEEELLVLFIIVIAMKVSHDINARV